MTDEPIIRISKLNAGYGDEIVLENISFDVLRGEIFAILGGSGCGKSTLMRHMVGLNRPQSGQVVIDGIDIANCPAADYHRVLRKIGVLFQSSALFGSMTLMENLLLPIAEYSGLQLADIEALIRFKLGLVNLNGYERHLPSELSGGMKKRAGLARALALSPAILFLDEPSAGLDPITSAEIDDLVLHINRATGTTLVIVTHEIDSVFRLAQRVIFLDKSAKGIVAEGDPRHLRQHSTNPLVRRFLQSKTP
jgi:phospholipid/cholesterol/gamma-HCH transport system ATP-binding protein